MINSIEKKRTWIFIYTLATVCLSFFSPFSKVPLRSVYKGNTNTTETSSNLRVNPEVKLNETLEAGGKQVIPAVVSDPGVALKLW
jgi:hypothetical protein